MNRKLSYESTLAIRAVTRNDLSRLLSTHFIPLEKTDFIDLRLGALKRYYEIALKYPPSETSNITVRNVNNLLVIESYIKNINLRARYCFDMQCGAMPVEYLSIRNEQGVHWQSRLQNYSGVWIPEEIQMVYKLSDGTQEWCKYIWKENTINAKIPKEVFSINSLGVHRGTTVYDYRTGAESVLSDSKLPPMPNDNIENLKHFSMTRIVLIVLGIILILIAVIAKIVKKIKENR
jgi:hypothetical protein